MAENNRRRNTVIVIIVILLILALLLLLTQCLPKKTPSAGSQVATTQPAPNATAVSAGATMPATTEPDEILTVATLTAPQSVTAGAVFAITWTGPDNRGDYVTIVPIDAPADKYTDYRETNKGKSLELTAPIEPGLHEVRYVTRRTRTVLGRAPIEVTPAGATLDALGEIVLGSQFAVTWTGPNNQGDYITIVPTDSPDNKYGNFTYTEKGSPLTLTAPTETGSLELRYITGQAHKILARRPIRVIAAAVTLAAPDNAIAGSSLAVTWTGPNNSGDYITVVSKEIPDGQYGNYTNTASGSPLKLLLPIMTGDAELRYMTGQGGKVLARRAIRINAATVTLTAPADAQAGAAVSVTWTGPNNSGDYITIVPNSTPDGQYAAYTVTAGGSPLNVNAPKEPGDAEVRYMTGQGNKVLARIPIKIVR